MGAVVLCSGCFTYVTADLDTVPTGEKVRVHLAEEGVAADVAMLSNRAGLRLDGTLVQGGRDQLVLRVPVGERATGIGTTTLGQDVTIPARSIVHFERREFNRARTSVVAAGGVIAFVTVLLSFGEGVPNPQLPPQGEDPAGFSGSGWGMSWLSVPVR